MDDDRRSNVEGDVSGVDASPAPDAYEPAARELGLEAKSLRARDTSNVPAEMRDPDAEDGDVDRRP